MFELFTIWAANIAPTLATIFISIAYLPQIIKTQKTKSVEDLSLGFWILINAFLICMLSNATYLLITADGLGYFLTELVNFIFAAIVLIQILVFRKKNKK